MRVWLVFGLLVATPVWANDVVVCDPTHPQVPNAVTQFQQSVDFPETAGYLVWVAPNDLMSPIKQTQMNLLRAQLDALRGVPVKYWLCLDTAPADGILDAVREMTQLEKDAVDALEIAERQQQQGLLTELSTLESDVDMALANWSSLTASQRTEALRKSMRLNRVERLLRGD
jgi:hypothetical protein